MTDEILIQPGPATNRGWVFTVTFSGRRHTVTCSQAFWKKMSREDISPMDVVRLGLRLALKHHITDSLPQEFQLDHLGSRIHDFEKHLRLAAQIEAAL